MNQSFLIDNLDDIKCLKHNQLPSFFSLEANSSLPDRILCHECVDDSCVPRSIMWRKGKEIMAKIQFDMNQQIATKQERMIGQLNSLYQNLDLLRSKLNIFFDSSTQTIKSWISDLSRQQNYKISYLLLIRELARQMKLIENQEILELDSVHNCNTNYSKKFKASLSSAIPFKIIYNLSKTITDILGEDDNSNQYQEMNEKLISLFQEIEQLKTSSSQKQETISRTTSQQNYDIQWSLVDQQQQESNCYAIASNSTGTRIATGSGKDIKIWDFEQGRMQQTNTILSEHQHSVTCLVFGKESGWLISGGLDNTIRSWKEVDDDDWKHKVQSVQQKHQLHENGITCLIFNHSDNQVLSSSSDKTIKVWHADYQRNEIKFIESLLKHTAAVQCISLSKSETHLVSCGQDKLIIVWKKILGQWKFIQQIPTEDFGYRVSFINDDIIAWQQFNAGQTHIFQYYQGQFPEKSTQQIALNLCNQDESYFPSVFLQNEQIFIQKHNKFVYILKLLNNGKVSLSAEPIECQDNKVYGCVVGSGKHLIIWNMKTKLFQVYEIIQK